MDEGGGKVYTCIWICICICVIGYVFVCARARTCVCVVCGCVVCSGMTERRAVSGESAGVEFRLIAPQRVFAIFASTPAEKDQWVEVTPADRVTV